MSSVDMAYVLFKDFLRFDPADPAWFNRDRFVLSAGHESMLLYALLTLRGILTLDDLAAFRQFGSRTPGHPENYQTPGVECTTGPLGQGFAMAVGMAVAETMLRERLGEDVAGHHTVVLSSDGDIQAPVYLGAAALAGLWGLHRLTVLFDKNQVQLSGPTSRCDATDHKKLFESLGWRVIEIDGHDHEAIRAALAAARAEKKRPTMIIGTTVIAKGSSTMEGNCASHGAPFTEAEIRETKKQLGLSEETAFDLPSDVLAHFQGRFGELATARLAWNARLEERLESDAAFEELWRQVRQTPRERKLAWPTFETEKPVATRTAWGAALNALIDQLPLLVGGSADLDPSNQTEKFRQLTGVFGRDNPLGRNLSFGVREFPMGAIVNGIALHGGLIPFGATFLIFSDYERNALRMSALQRLPALHVFTHDSFYVGEDGPTHEPIEQTSSLRLIPNMLVMRPADANETCGRPGRGPDPGEPAHLPAAHPPEPARPRSQVLSQLEGRRAARRLHSRGGPGRHSGSDPAGCGLGSEPGHGSGQAAAGQTYPHRQSAELRAFQRTRRRLPRQCAAARRHAALRRGGRTAGTVVPVHRKSRPGARHLPFRRLGPGRQALRGLRLHGGTTGEEN